MTKWTNLLLRVFFKIAILFLAMLVTFTAGTIFHFRSNGWIAGIIFLAVAFGLFIVLKRIFPSVYGRPPGPMSKRVAAALLGVPLFLATLWGAYSLSFNFYVEYWWMPLDKYGVRTPLRWQDVVFIAAVWSVLLVLFYVSYRLLKFAFHRERSA